MTPPNIPLEAAAERIWIFDISTGKQQSKILGSKLDLAASTVIFGKNTNFPKIDGEAGFEH